METADVIVIGLGAVGSATLHRLTLAGARAIGVDRFDPPHDRGSSHGESRITRLAVGEGEAYAPLVRRSHAIWRELEAQSGQTLFLQCGGLIMGPRAGGALHHGKDDFVRRSIAIAEAEGIAHEALDAAGIASRFPQFALGGDEIGYYEPEAGAVFPERCIALQLALAEAGGARVFRGETVLALRDFGSGTEITTDRRVLQAGRVVLAAGPWGPGLAGGRAAELARVYRQTLHWYPPDDPAAYAPERFPVFIWMHGAGEEDYLYGFPSLDGGRTVKLASERYGRPVDPDHVGQEVSAAESDDIFSRHVAGRLRGVGSACVRAATCLYTVTPDAGFLIDRLPEHPGVLLASACSGHGFKHSAGLGEELARLALSSAPVMPGEFAVSRFQGMTTWPAR